MTSPTEERKADHLRLAQGAVEFPFASGFERWHFIHNALPELNLEDVDVSLDVFGKRLSFPFVIGAMSGGEKHADRLNRVLARAAQAEGCALALGSLRPWLENPSLKEKYLALRQYAPDIPLFANIGISQLIAGVTQEQAADLCRTLQADALVVHLNPLQEAIQPEGEPFFAGALRTLQEWVQTFPLPLIVKEVGQGLSVSVIERLAAAGITWVEIAGAGGTNWLLIEKARLPENDPRREAAEYFRDWGEPTALVLEQCPLPKVRLIAGGGIRSPLDMAKALALGATLVSAARPILMAAMQGGIPAVRHLLQVWRETLKLVLFGTGRGDIKTFHGDRSLLRKH